MNSLLITIIYKNYYSLYTYQQMTSSDSISLKCVSLGEPLDINLCPDYSGLSARLSCIDWHGRAGAGSKRSAVAAAAAAVAAAATSVDGGGAGGGSRLRGLET